MHRSLWVRLGTLSQCTYPKRRTVCHVTIRSDGDDGVRKDFLGACVAITLIGGGATGTQRTLSSLLCTSWRSTLTAPAEIPSHSF